MCAMSKTDSKSTGKKQRIPKLGIFCFPTSFFFWGVGGGGGDNNKFFQFCSPWMTKEKGDQKNFECQKQSPAHVPDQPMFAMFFAVISAEAAPCGDKRTLVGTKNCEDFTAVAGGGEISDI